MNKKDLKHLEWCYMRMVNVHKEKLSVDYMVRMNEILQNIRTEDNMLNKKMLDDILLDRVVGEIEVIHNDIDGDYLGCEVVFYIKDLYPVRLLTRHGVLKARNSKGETAVITGKVLALIIAKYDGFAEDIARRRK